MENNNLSHGQIELSVDDMEKTKPVAGKNKKKIILIACAGAVLVVMGILLFVFRDILFVSNNEKNRVTLIQDTPKPVQFGQEYKAPPGFEHDLDQDGLLDEQEAKLGTSDTQYDSDGDGIPDKTEIDEWGTDPNKVDTDGDGFSDTSEIIRGYNPKGPGKL